MSRFHSYRRSRTASRPVFSHITGLQLRLITTLHSLLEIAASPRMVLTRRDEGELFHLDDGASVRVLVGGPDHSFEARETIAAPGAAMHEPWVHIGEDLVIVLEGVIVYEVGDEAPVELHAGDVLAFPADRPHTFRVAGDERARLIIVNTPPGSPMTGRD